jgi:L-threonylcarbamoyladenylate synthase
VTTVFSIRKAAGILDAGGVIAYPTEGVYGIGCRPDNLEAVNRVLTIKGRKAGAGLILIAPDADMFANWIAPSDIEASRLASKTTGPVSWIVTAAPHVDPILTGGRKTLAVRLVSHSVVSELCYATGSPLVSTSANRSGHRAAKTSFQARCWLGNELDYVISGPLGGASGPSEIRVAQSNQVIRPGSAPK